jgi:hypothetical protein
MRNALTRKEINKATENCKDYLKNNEDVFRIGHIIHKTINEAPSPHAISQVRVKLSKSKKYEITLHPDQTNYKGDYEVSTSHKGFFEKYPFVEKIIMLIIGAGISIIVALTVWRLQNQSQNLRELRQDSALKAIGDSLRSIQSHQKTTFTKPFSPGSHP